MVRDPRGEARARFAHVRILGTGDAPLAAAIAIAAAQMEQRAGQATAVEGAQGARLSPWVAAARSTLR